MYFRYVFVGCGSALSYYFLLWFFGKLFGKINDLTIIASYIIAVFLHFSLNRKYTFPGSRKFTLEVFRYFIFLIFNSILFYIVFKISDLIFNFNVHISSALAIFVTSISGYFFSKLIVFKER